MNKVFCSVEERFVNPLFEVFDGGDFILSSYRDIEKPLAEVQIFFPDEALSNDARTALQNALDVIGCRADIQTAVVPDEDWRLSYRRHFKTEKASKNIILRPVWESLPETNNGEIVISLDPGLAFGTGKHETTKACLQYIDELPHEGSFLDMGAGSGILSIAASLLGFSPVNGFDIDEETLPVAKENAALNGAAAEYCHFALGKGAKAPFGPADTVAANILGPVLIAFAGEVSSYAKKNLIASGILNEIYADVVKAFANCGFTEISHKTIGEWTTGLFSRIA